MLKLNELRKQRKITLDRVASATGIDVGSLSRIERGQQFPRPLTAEKLAAFYGVAVGELYDMVLSTGS